MAIYPLAGIGLPIVGPHTGPAAIREIALAAERLGFHSVSPALRRLLAQEIPAGEALPMTNGPPPMRRAVRRGKCSPAFAIPARSSASTPMALAKPR